MDEKTTLEIVSPSLAPSSSTRRGPEPLEFDFRQMVERGADGVALLEADGTIRYINPAGAALLGKPTSALIGQSLGRPVLVGQTTEIDIVNSETRRIVELRATSARGVAPSTVLVGLRDVTAHRRLAHDRLILAQAGAKFAASEDVPTTIEDLVDLLLEELADACIVDLEHLDGTLRCVVARYRTLQDLPEPTFQRLGRLEDPEHQEYEALDARLQLLQWNRPFLFRDLVPESFSGLPIPDSRRKLFQELGVRSLLIVPLRGRKSIPGAVTLLQTRQRGRFDSIALETASELSHLAALAIENARKLSQFRSALDGRDAYLSMIGHELRNPLASITQAADYIQKSKAPEAELQKFVGLFSRQSQYMTRLLEDLLDVSRIALGSLQFKFRPVILQDVLKLAVEGARSSIESKRHRLSIEAPESAIQLQGDSDRLVQVIVNLLVNAASYTPVEGVIAISVTSAEGHAILQIKDNGIGLSPEQQKVLFDGLGQRADPAQGIECGLGIGLMIVQEIVHGHGGTINAESPGVGLGSTFTVKLPFRRPDSTVGGRVVHSDAVEEKSPSASSVRILIVEDHPDVCETLRKLLENEGHQVWTAANASEALRTLRGDLPDLALIDIGLPGDDGFSVARTIREDPTLQGLYLVSFTGYTLNDERDQGTESDFDAHLTKPLQLQEFAEIVQDLRSRQ